MINFKNFYYTEEENQQIYTDNFKKWFGDWENDSNNSSKVVDSNGKPLIVYHGTSKDFKEFNKLNQNFPDYTIGYHFFDDPKESSKYAQNFDNGKTESNPNVKPVYLNIKHPLEITTPKGEGVTSYADMYRSHIIKQIVDASKTNSPYDGIIIKALSGDHIINVY